MIGYEANDSLVVITYEAKASLIHLQRFYNLNRVFENHYKANAQLFKDKVTFISRHRTIEPSDADGDIKIYLDQKYLWLFAENNENKAMGTCSVFKIDLATGKAVNKGIFDYSGEKWNTMLCGDKILKVSKTKGITLEVYDFDNSQPIFSTTLSEGSEISKRTAYERRGASYEVFPIDVQQSLKAWGRPIVIPLVVQPDSILLQIGNYEPTIVPKGVGLPNLGSIFELSRIASYLVNQKVSVDRYFYLQGNFKSGFSYKSNPETLIKTIDDFEITDRDNPLFVNFKGYVRSRKAAFGIYKFEKLYDELVVEKF